MKNPIVILAAVLISGCATMGERITDLNPGMTKAQVVRELGRPDAYRQADDEEALIYRDRLVSGWAWDRADYVVILRDGRVVEFGAGSVRRSSVGGADHTLKGSGFTLVPPPSRDNAPLRRPVYVPSPVQEDQDPAVPLSRGLGGKDVCNCKGYAGPGGPCYSGPGGPAYDVPGGPAYSGPGGPCYAGHGGPAYDGPGGPAYGGPGGPLYDGPGGPAYDGPGGPAYSGPGGPCYAGPGGPCYSGPGGDGLHCPRVCK